MESVEVMGYQVSAEFPKLGAKDKSIVNTINPHSYWVAKKDKAFREALLESNTLLPDGIGIVMAARILNGVKIHKIAGYDLFAYLMEDLNRKGGRCFFLGSSERTLHLIENQVKRDFPNINATSFSPPFKQVFDHDDDELMIAKINAFCPDVLFVGMTAPKQEKWVKKNKDLINANMICSIGAVFDFYAGTVKRASPIWVKLGLEWMFRLIREPKRLWKRNFVSTPIFIFDVLKTKLEFKNKNEQRHI